MPTTQALHSWKEIANYIGRSVRTCQRWEAIFGLPVRRPSGHDRSAVYALQQELDTWLTSTPHRESPDVEQLQHTIEQLQAEVASLRAQLSQIEPRPALPEDSRAARAQEAAREGSSKRTDGGKKARPAARMLRLGSESAAD